MENNYQNVENVGKLITTDMIKNSYSLIKDALKQVSFEDLEKIDRNLEKNKINSLIPCSKSMYIFLRNRIGALNPKKVKEIISERFYDLNVMESVSCIINSIYQISNKEYVTPIENIKNWLRNLYLINVESLEGYVFNVGLEEIKNVFVIKTPKEDKQDLTHELFIGLNINKLRKNIPNFVYTFGGFFCSKLFSEDSNVLGWCNTEKNSTDFIITEFIYPNVTLRNFLKTCSFDDFLAIYLQILYALDFANKKLDFTHYDLHDQNVLIKTLDEYVYIPYTTERGLEYINTNKIAVIIDFGFSHIKYNDKSFGVYDYIQYGVLYKSSFPLFDAYKILLFSIRQMEYEKDCYNKTAEIIKFFNNTTHPEEIIETQRTFNYGIYITKNIKKIKIFHLTTFIRNNFNPDFIGNIKIKTQKILNCEKCMSSQDVNEFVGINKYPFSDTLFEFYDLGSRLYRDKKFSEFDELVKNLDYDIASKEYVKIFNEDINNFNFLYGILQYEPIRSRVYSISDKQINSFSINLNNIIKIFNISQSIDTKINVSKFSFNAFKNFERLNKINDVVKIYNMLKEELKKIYKEIILDSESLIRYGYNSEYEHIFETLKSFSKILE
uniref:Protein kinase n=1 Tax=Pithovirus LCPAC104 TaxID=2506589 RepID=A0A481Z497_9VIRU|nr:MAG: protein kinase [Pithovirus LCPAC104]